MKRHLLTCAVLAAMASVSAHAAVTIPADVPAPQNVPYPGTLTLQVDATDLAHRVFGVHETIPVQAGKLTLLYPAWIPGDHSPTGPIDKVAGLKISAGGKPLAWVRDQYDVYAFHVDVPAGVSSIDVDFQMLSAQNSGQGRILMTPEMESIQWANVSLSPAGHYARQITVQPSVKLPVGWQFGTALTTASQVGNVVSFQPINYDDLVDSPILAGKYFKRLDLDPKGRSPVHLDVVADDAASLDVTPKQLEVHRQLVHQMDKLYGARHYNHYDFLLSLTKKLGMIGLEHHRSSEDGASPGYFTKWDENWYGRDLLAHEYNHSWDGKYRRGFDLNTPNFDVPMGDSLLWVYEGQTQYWGYMVSARSGLMTPEQDRDVWALAAATYDRNRPALDWRSIADTTNDPTIAQRSPLPYRNYQMSEDYYVGGALIWLSVDTKLRELSHEKKSLNDFAHAFFGVNDGAWDVDPYHFEDVVSTLNSIVPYDWASFLRSRLDAHKAPLDGLERAGWKLSYDATPSPAIAASEAHRHYIDAIYSLGLAARADGSLYDVVWNGPAFKAGLGAGMVITAVNGKTFSPDVLKAAITAAKTGTAPIELMVKNFDEFQTIKIDYHGGLQYPHLVRIPNTKDRLSAIMAPMK